MDVEKRREKTRKKLSGCRAGLCVMLSKQNSIRNIQCTAADTVNGFVPSEFKHRTNATSFRPQPH